MMNRALFQFAFFAIVALITFGSIQNPFTSSYIDNLEVESVAVSKNSKGLLKEIEARAGDYEEAPQDAQIHKVWKAIPGLNGQTVDKTASFNNMEKFGKFDEEKLIFKETEPKVKLKDLPPAPVYKGHPEKLMVSFAINVAWGNEYLPSMLKTLKAEGVRATFFLEGKWTKNNPELAKMIVEAGHEVGNHSYSHPNFKVLSNSTITKELEEANAVINAVTGKEPVWFGPPSGSYADNTVTLAAKQNMRTVLWSVDTIDWKNPEPQKMVQRITEKVHPGAIILMHPTSSTAAGLQAMIENIKKKGYQIDDLSTMLSEKRAN